MCRISEEIKAEGKMEVRAEMIRRVMEVNGFSFAQACDLLVLSSGERSALKEFFQS